MSYGATAALQTAIYDRLLTDSGVASLSGGAIFDALPPGPVPTLYVSLGPERVRDRSDKTGRAALYEFPVTVISSGVGFLGAKALAAAVSDALDGVRLALGRGEMVHMEFLRARARRVGGGREIEIWFRALIDEGVA